MSVIAQPFKGALEALISQKINWMDDDIKVMLLDDTEEPDLLTDTVIGDVEANEISGQNYAAGGQPLGTKSIDDGTNPADTTITLKAANSEWTDATITAHYGIIYNNTEHDGDKVLIGMVDFGENKSVAGGIFRIAWADGVVIKMIGASIGSST